MLDRPRRSRRSRSEERFWDESFRNPLALGCTRCSELGVCGGLHASSGAFNCTTYCCGNPKNCDVVCQRNPDFVARVREVSGFSLATVPRAPVVQIPILPDSIPFIYHRARRESPFCASVVALSLYQLLNRSTGAAKFGTPQSLRDYFQIGPQTAVLLSGTADDQPLERWWAAGDKRITTLQKLCSLGVVAVTSPNFSVFTDVPRWDNLHAFKRIAICWQEMASVGLPAALHVNARTERDWEGWTEFVLPRPEVSMLAYEFATGASGRRRLSWHVDRLCSLAERVRRPISLIVRGGSEALPELRKAFHRVCFLDTTSFMKTVNWKCASLSGDTLRWERALESEWARENLLEHNYLAMKEATKS